MIKKEKGTKKGLNLFQSKIAYLRMQKEKDFKKVFKKVFKKGLKKVFKKAKKKE